MGRDRSTTEQIRRLELRLLDPEVRASPGELSRLIADDFVEFGSSGRVYDKQGVIASLQGEMGVSFSVRDFQARILASDVVLATYRITRSMANNEQPKNLL